MDIERAMKNERLLKSLIGVTLREFEELTTIFGQLIYETANAKKRKRKIGAGSKGVLKTAKKKLFFILFYMKIYPTFDLAGFIFGVDRSRTCRWVQQWMPLLEKALGRACVLPKRQIRSIKEFLETFPEIKDLFVDGTERRTQRPKSSKNEKRRYSGKKKAHTRKNIVVSDEHKRVLMLSPTKNGQRHDKRLLDKVGWLSGIPPNTTLWVDSGFQGIEHSLHKNVTIMRPKKRSKLKPLTSEQKEENRIISSLRIIVENAICGIKRFNTLNQIYRNKNGQDDLFMMIASGLWNFHLNFA